MISSPTRLIGSATLAFSRASVSRLLSLAAAPTFAAMALMTAMRPGGEPDVLCSAESALPLAGMVPMDPLMSAFHVAPGLAPPSR